MPMIRKAFMMSLKPGYEEEYKRRHNPIWPELQETLRRLGASNYSIFLEPGTNRLYAYVEIESEELWRKVAETPVCRRWWAFMEELMQTNADQSPVTLDLSEVFHMD